MVYKYFKMKWMVAAVAIAAALAFPLGGYAVPAYPGVIETVQPDGSTLKVLLKGDERSHRVCSTDGYLLMRDADGFLTYAIADTEGLPMPSAWRASDEGKRGAAELQFLARLHQGDITKAYERRDRMNMIARQGGESPRMLCSGAAFPSKDSPRALVVLVEYQDKACSMDDPKSFFDRMLNEEGFSEYNATGSVRDFFVENSHEVFTPRFDVYGPVKLQYNYSHYGANVYGGNDAAPQEMLIEACEQLDDTVDFGVYDTNDDGQIDNVFIFYAGYGEADSNLSNTVWPHSADLLDYQLGKDYIFDGKLLNRYACTNEMDYNNRRPGGIGTFVHEFSHVMGLPDLYATSYSASFTPGTYSTLDMGPYNNNGRTPPHYSIFERYCLDWLDPEPIDSAGEYTLPALHTSNKGYIIHTNYDDEFFLLENRQQDCCDAYIPGHGMLVWHIDYVPNIWNMNIVNNTPSHQYVDLVEADNRRSDSNRAADPFPGTNNVRGFNHLSTPALRAWNGDHIGIGLFDITESEGVISFRTEINAAGTESIEVPADGMEISGRLIRNLSDGEVTVYDMSGMAVANLASGVEKELPAGMYVMTSGAGQHHKVYLR